MKVDHAESRASEPAPSRDLHRNGEGADSGGRSNHTADCQCVRCLGFTPGHVVSVRHGAYSPRLLKQRADELTQSIRAVLQEDDLWDDSAEADVSGLALALARLEIAQDAEPGSRLSLDAQTWARSTLRYLEALGMTPPSYQARSREIDDRADMWHELRDLVSENLTTKED